MEVHVQPDRATLSKFDAIAEQERVEASTPQPRILEEERMGEMFIWAPQGYDKARELTPGEKILAEKLDAFLTEKAEVRDEICWAEGCTHTASYWVREVKFDMKTDAKAASDFRQVTSADYDGPIPGFCLGHIGSGPPLLAQAVYFTKPEMQWGLKPRRWFVVFTDGTQQGGECLEIDPLQKQPQFVEEFRPLQENHAS